MKKIIFPLLSLLILGGCVSGRTTLAAPELIAPAAMIEDTAEVKRGSFDIMTQHRGFMRVKSHELYYEGDAIGLSFKEYTVIAGQEVNEGDVLALLDTEMILDYIEDQEEHIANLKMEHEFQNAFSALDIDTARAEYVKMVREAGLNEALVEAAEQKKNSIEALELSFKHQVEKQALTIEQEEINLQELHDTVSEAELRAPFSGIVSYIEPKVPGESVRAYEPIIYLTDKSDMFLELVGTYTASRIIDYKGIYNNIEYDLERVPITRQEQLFYNSLRLPAPIRYYVILNGKEGEHCN